MNTIKTIDDIHVTKQRILLRVDFNVALTKSKKRIGDDTRIKQGLPTISELLKKKAVVILVSHLGRPDGKRIKRYSLAPVARRLAKLINLPVKVIEDFTTSNGRMKLASLEPGSVTLLENIRFYKGEERNDPLFAKKLSEIADLYVNDSFGTDHRVHASTVGVTKYLPSYAGRLLETEMRMIKRLVQRPRRPFVAIIGGAKAETKITLIDRLLELADQLLVGGGVANTFFHSWGFETGTAKVDREMVEVARSVIWKASQTNTALVLPTDVIVGRSQKQVMGSVDSDKIPPYLKGLDIGPKTRQLFAGLIAKGMTIVWNGPMGVYEERRLRKGTETIYRAISANSKAYSIVGGGDTLAAMTQQRHVGKITHISTGGGALLEFIEKGTLPAIESLRK